MSDAIVDYTGKELSMEKEEGITSIADATNDMGKDVDVPSIMPMKRHQIQHSRMPKCSFSPVICDRNKWFRPSTSATYQSTPEQGVSIIQSTKQNENMALSSPDKNSNNGELPSHTQCTQHIISHESIGDTNSTGYTGNLMTTPTLTLTFSPFLSFSDERPPTSMTGIKPFETNKMIESGTQHQKGKLNIYTLNDQRGLAETQSEICESADENVTASVQTECKTDEFDENNFSTVSETEEQDDLSDITLTYADNLLLNATKCRGALSPSASKPRKQCLSKPSSGKKRKNNSSSEKSSRQPQKRYSTGVNNDCRDEIFGSKSDGKIRLTTNIPREVEALDPVSGRRVQLFASCSAASRAMGINRTRMSRTCRAGGGKIGDFIFRYVEMTISSNDNSGKSDTEKSTSPNPRRPSSQLDRTVVAAASALLLL